MNIKKITALFLALILIFAALISCNSANKNNTSATGDNSAATDPNATAAPGETATERIDPNLPSEDYGGYTFTFFAHKIDYAGDWIGDGDPRELVAEEETGDPINDAVYARNRMIEAKYNINIKMVTNSSDAATLKKAVNAGDSVYDAAVIFNNLVPSVVTAGLLVNVKNLPYIDLSKPWWDPAVNAMSIDHKNYLMSGDNG